MSARRCRRTDTGLAHQAPALPAEAVLQAVRPGHTACNHTEESQAPVMLTPVPLDRQQAEALVARMQEAAERAAAAAAELRLAADEADRDAEEARLREGASTYAAADLAAASPPAADAGPPAPVDQLDPHAFADAAIAAALQTVRRAPQGAGSRGRGRACGQGRGRGRGRGRGGALRAAGQPQEEQPAQYSAADQRQATPAAVHAGAPTAAPDAAAVAADMLPTLPVARSPVARPAAPLHLQEPENAAQTHQAPQQQPAGTQLEMAVQEQPDTERHQQQHGRARTHQQPQPRPEQVQHAPAQLEQRAGGQRKRKAGRSSSIALPWWKRPLGPGDSKPLPPPRRITAEEAGLKLPTVASAWPSSQRPSAKSLPESAAEAAPIQAAGAAPGQSGTGASSVVATPATAEAVGVPASASDPALAAAGPPAAGQASAAEQAVLQGAAGKPAERQCVAAVEAAASQLPAAEAAGSPEDISQQQEQQQEQQPSRSEPAAQQMQTDKQLSHAAAIGPVPAACAEAQLAVLAAPLPAAFQPASVPAQPGHTSAARSAALQQLANTAPPAAAAGPGDPGPSASASSQLTRSAGPAQQQQRRSPQTVALHRGQQGSSPGQRQGRGQGREALRAGRPLARKADECWTEPSPSASAQQDSIRQSELQMQGGRQAQRRQQQQQEACAGAIGGAADTAAPQRRTCSGHGPDMSLFPAGYKLQGPSRRQPPPEQIMRISHVRPSLVGRMIALLWAEDDRWWPACITDFAAQGGGRAGKRRALVTLYYETGEKEEGVDLLPLVRNGDVAWLLAADAELARAEDASGRPRGWKITPPATAASRTPQGAVAAPAAAAPVAGPPAAAATAPEAGAAAQEALPGPAPPELPALAQLPSLPLSELLSVPLPMLTPDVEAGLMAASPALALPPELAAALNLEAGAAALPPGMPLSGLPLGPGMTPAAGMPSAVQRAAEANLAAWLQQPVADADVLEAGPAALGGGQAQPQLIVEEEQGTVPASQAVAGVSCTANAVAAAEPGPEAVETAGASAPSGDGKQSHTSAAEGTAPVSRVEQGGAAMPAEAKSDEQQVVEPLAKRQRTEADPQPRVVQHHEQQAHSAASSPPPAQQPPLHPRTSAGSVPSSPVPSPLQVNGSSALPRQEAHPAHEAASVGSPPASKSAGGPAPALQSQQAVERMDETLEHGPEAAAGQQAGTQAGAEGDAEVLSESIERVPQLNLNTAGSGPLSPLSMVQLQSPGSASPVSLLKQSQRQAATALHVLSLQQQHQVRGHDAAAVSSQQQPRPQVPLTSAGNAAQSMPSWQQMLPDHEMLLAGLQGPLLLDPDQPLMLDEQQRMTLPPVVHDPTQPFPMLGPLPAFVPAVLQVRPQAAPQAARPVRPHLTQAQQQAAQPKAVQVQPPQQQQRQQRAGQPTAQQPALASAMPPARPRPELHVRPQQTGTRPVQIVVRPSRTAARPQQQTGPRPLPTRPQLLPQARPPDTDKQKGAAEFAGPSQLRDIISMGPRACGKKAHILANGEVELVTLLEVKEQEGAVRVFSSKSLTQKTLTLAAEGAGFAIRLVP